LSAKDNPSRQEISVLARRVGKGGEDTLILRFPPMFQRPMNAGEGNLRPRNIVPRKQLHFEAFGTGGEFFFFQPRAIHQLHLAQTRYGIDRKQPIKNDLAFRFLPRFAARTILRRLVFFEITRR
jgi:hypothetical protein